MTQLLEGRRLLITGVLTDRSLAFAAAEAAIEQGATVVLTGFGRGLSLTRRVARRLPGDVTVLELDVTDADQLAGLAGQLRPHLDGLDGVLHAIGFAPPAAIGSGVLRTAWPDVAVALQISTWSYVALAHACLPLLTPGASYVGLDFDARVAWPSYDWMGVAKAGLESANRYLARELGPHGVRCNLVAAGPVRTMAAKAIPGFADIEAVWSARAPLGWDVADPSPVARTVVALLSDWLPATTGSIVYADGGASAIGL